MAAFDPSGRDGINDINITPFVDVVLVLLVIFMVTAPMMIKESLNLKLPQSVSADASEPARLGIAVNKLGEILLNGELVSIDTLEAQASLAATENQNVQALLSADEKAYHGDVIKVIDVIKRAGIENFAFQIERIVSE